MLCMGSEKSEPIYLNMSHLIYMPRLDAKDAKKMRFWHASSKENSMIPLQVAIYHLFLFVEVHDD